MCADQRQNELSCRRDAHLKQNLIDADLGKTECTFRNPRNAGTFSSCFLRNNVL